MVGVTHGLGVAMCSNRLDSPDLKLLQPTTCVSEYLCIPATGSASEEAYRLAALNCLVDLVVRESLAAYALAEHSGF